MADRRDRMTIEDKQIITFQQLQNSDERYIQDVIICNEQVDGVLLERFSLTNVIFERCIFVDCHFSKWDLTDVLFKHCDLSNCKLEGGYFYRTSFINCKLLGTKFSTSHFKQCSFDQCFANYVSFSEAQFDKTVFY